MSHGVLRALSTPPLGGAPLSPHPQPLPVHAAAATIELLVTPASIYPGGTVSATWDAPSSVVLPLKLYLKGANDAVSSFSWTLPGLSGSGADIEVPVEAKPGDWVFFVEDSASLLVSYSPNVPVQLTPPKIILLAPLEFSVGTSPEVLYEVAGVVKLPLTLFAKMQGNVLSTLSLPLDASAVRVTVPLPSTLQLQPGLWNFFIEDAASFSSNVQTVEVLPLIPNAVATFNATEAIVPLLLATLAYATPEQLNSWMDTSSVCAVCPGCAQLGVARSAPHVITSTDGINQCFVVQLESDTTVGDTIAISFRGTSNRVRVLRTWMSLAQTTKAARATHWLETYAFFTAAFTLRTCTWRLAWRQPWPVLYP